ncbi:MAG: hypothetical protein IJY52_06780 [Anaerotignum sp.]|nr:hypothetical protein [Anaerotignum sp.]
MEKLLIFVFIIMSLVCMMTSAMVLAYKTQGLAVFVAGISVNPAAVGGLMMLFAVLFLLLAARVALKMRKR